MTGRSVKAAFASAVGAVLLASCGETSATTTVEMTTTGGTVSVVVTASQANITKIEDGIKGGSNSIPGVSVTAVDGDQHSGGLVCQTDATAKDGESGHIAIYSTLAGVTSAFCDQMKQSIQNA